MSHLLLRRGTVSRWNLTQQRKPAATSHQIVRTVSIRHPDSLVGVQHHRGQAKLTYQSGFGKRATVFPARPPSFSYLVVRDTLLYSRRQAVVCGARTYSSVALFRYWGNENGVSFKSEHQNTNEKLKRATGDPAFTPIPCRAFCHVGAFPNCYRSGRASTLHLKINRTSSRRQSTHGKNANSYKRHQLQITVGANGCDKHGHKFRV